MLNRVLVVDDEYISRRPGYRSLFAVSKRLNQSYPIEIDFAETPLDVPLMIGRIPYSLILVDVKLGKWNEDLRRILDYIPPNIPVCLVSEHWNDTTSDEINHALAKPNCKTFFQWSEITGSVADGTRVRVLMQITKIIAESKGQDSTIRLGPDDPIFLVHLSDLHIKSDDEVDWDPEASHASEAIRRACGDSAPTFFAITGDFTHHGRPDEFRRAERWLLSLFRDTKFGQVPSGRLFLVPGNHDVCLPLLFSSRVRLGEADENGRRYLEDAGTDLPEQLELVSSGLEPYRQFATTLTGRPCTAWTDESVSLPWVESQFRHLGVVFYGLNTARPLSSKTTTSREVDHRALTKIRARLREVRSSPGKAPMVIGMTHHSPIGDIRDRSVTNPEAFTMFFDGDARTSAILHGHAHRRDVDWVPKHRIIRCGSPTMKSGARPEDTLRGFSVMEIRRAKHDPIAAYVSCFDWHDGGLVLSKTEAFSRRRDGTFEPDSLARGR